MSYQWKSRRAIRLQNETAEAVILEGGGHIARFQMHEPQMENLLWEPSWPTADPQTLINSELQERYGGGALGPYFATWSGHALCLDLFGIPTNEESARGIPLHGEAASMLWNLTQKSASRLSATVALPASGLTIAREFELVPDCAALFCSTTVTNPRNVEHHLQWVEHATFGQPLVTGDCQFSASVAHGLTWQEGYEGHEVLSDDQVFEWPFAKTIQGEMLDLSRPFQAEGRGFVAALQQDSARDFGFVVVGDPRESLCGGYVFPKNEFPWLTVWEENRARDYPPWNGTTQARGMEFGSTPFPLGLDWSRKHPELMGSPTELLLPAHGSITKRWLMFAARVPVDFHVTDLQLFGDSLSLISSSSQVTVPVRGALDFFNGAGS